MSFTITQIHKFRDDRLHLFLQSNCRYWLARFFAEGRYKVVSTKTTSFLTAKTFALDWYDRIRFEQKNGVPVHGRKFKDVVNQFLEYQEVLVASNDKSASLANDYQIRLQGPISWFNDRNIQEITSKLINEYKDHRLKSGVTFNTIKHDFVPLRQVLKYAKEQEWIKSLPEFPSISRKITSNPRSWFSKDEWKYLLKVARERIESSRGTRQRWEREQLYDFMIFMVHTGLRVEETLRVTYRDCVIEQLKDVKDPILKIIMRGKTGVRQIIGTVGAVQVLKRLKERNNPKDDDPLFPQNHRDQLNALLKETKLKIDKYGKVRNAKSFRSTYIMFRLLHKVPIKDIAVNCGTSSGVIDKFYAKYLTSDLIAESLSDLPK